MADILPAAAGLPAGTGVGAPADREFTVRERSQARLVLRRFMRHRLAVASAVVFLLTLLLAFIGPYVWKYSYLDITDDNSQPPSWVHPLGTDSIGHDYLAQVLRGLQHSELIAFMIMLIAVVTGTIIGAASGFYRGVVDSIVMRFSDLMLTIPVIAIAAALGSNSGGKWWMIGLILGLLSVWYVARLVRGVVLSLREREFIEAAKALGASDWWIIWRHLVPNAIGPVIVLATILVAAGVLAETGLSYIGFGVQPPDTSLGSLINAAQGAVQTRPWLFYSPGLFILLIALSINFIGDGLRDAFDPQQTRQRR